MTNVLRIRLNQAEILIRSADPITHENVELAQTAYRSLLEHQVTKPGVHTDTSGMAEAERSGEDDLVYDQGIDTFVAKFGGTSGREILKAAALHLTLVDKSLSFPRNGWFARAADAHSWKSSYANQRSRDVQRMIASGEIIQKNGGLVATTTSGRKSGSSFRFCAIEGCWNSPGVDVTA